MNIRIYQINRERDTNNVAFLNYKNLERFQGAATLRSEIYDKVFEGDVGCQSLEDVYLMFNLSRPKGYVGRSLSVSDVVEILEADTHSHSFYFCDSIGFKPVAFEPVEEK